MNHDPLLGTPMFFQGQKETPGKHLNPLQKWETSPISKVSGQMCAEPKLCFLFFSFFIVA